MIPGFIISWITFPGVIVHEAAHLLFCRIRGVMVYDVRFFRFGNPCGYVVHAPTEDFTSAFLISVGPFIINSLACMFICVPALIPFRVFGVTDPVSYAVLWLGVSIGMHAFPSTQDANNLYMQAKKAAKTGNVLAWLSFPLVGLIYLANILSVVWFDYLYGIFIGLVLPSKLL